jgi:hypothetical protein
MDTMQKILTLAAALGSNSTSVSLSYFDESKHEPHWPAPPPWSATLHWTLDFNVGARGETAEAVTTSLLGLLRSTAVDRVRAMKAERESLSSKCDDLGRAIEASL